jgi:hypothetical protein
VFSRPTSSSSSQKRKANVSREDKERLLRIAKRPRKGPFNSVQDTSEFQSGEGAVGLSEAVKASGSYDAWVEEPEVVLPDGLETVHKKKVKVSLAGLFWGSKSPNPFRHLYLRSLGTRSLSLQYSNLTKERHITLLSKRTRSSW